MDQQQSHQHDQHLGLHGSEAGYKAGCRQPCCKKAHSERMAEQRDRRREITEKHPEWVPHGASGYKNWGCKCEICTDAHTEELAEYREHQRRQRALRKQQELEQQGQRELEQREAEDDHEDG